MQIWKSILEARLDLDKTKRRTVVTIGNFDGVHRGHQAIMKRTVELARQSESLAVAFTFSNHSEGFLGEQPFLLNTPDLRKELLANQGVDVLLEVEFNQSFASLTPEVFFKTWLIEGLHLHTLVVGYDFKFGAGGQGQFVLLQELAKAYRVGLERLDPVYEGKQIISSSKIRQLLAEGQIELANRMLDYAFTIEGEVIEGEKVGRKLGFPTANIRLDPKYLLPCYGVYFVKLMTGEKNFYGLANVGVKPTFGQYQPLVEVYLIDTEVNLYHQWVRVEFHHFIRPENRFAGPEALKAQIQQDLETARGMINHERLGGYK